MPEILPSEPEKEEAAPLGTELSCSFVEPSNPRNRRSGKVNLSAFLERVLREVDAERFPIKHRRRDCERFNQFPETLNACHQAGDIERLRREIAAVERALMYGEE